MVNEKTRARLLLIISKKNMGVLVFQKKNLMSIKNPHLNFNLMTWYHNTVSMISTDTGGSIPILYEKKQSLNSWKNKCF